jgi:hypothetical protein
VKPGIFSMFAMQRPFRREAGEQNQALAGEFP